MNVNDYQRAVLRDYSDGDFSYLAEQQEISEEDINGLGDSLLKFILVELSNEKDCEDLETAFSRTQRAKDDLDVCLVALQKLHDAIVERQRLDEALA
jgi:hypothetical protein